MLINYKKEVVTTSFVFLHLCRGTLLQYLPASMIFAVLDTCMLIENTWTNKINPLYLSCISNIYFRYCAKFNTLYIWGGY